MPDVLFSIPAGKIAVVRSEDSTLLLNLANEGQQSPLRLTGAAQNIWDLAEENGTFTEADAKEYLLGKGVSEPAAAERLIATVMGVLREYHLLEAK